jgi:hypothetical protein
MSGSLFAGESSEIPLAKQVRRARSVAMDENSDREELEKKLEQSRRMAAGQTDPVRQGWLFTLVRDLERRLQDQQ